MDNRAKEREAIALAAKNRSFKMVSDDSEPEEIVHKKVKKSKKSKKEKVEDFEDGFDQMERERREDLEERDAFAQRVIKRDKEKKRNVAEKVSIFFEIESLHIYLFRSKSTFIYISVF